MRKSYSQRLLCATGALLFGLCSYAQKEIKLLDRDPFTSKPIRFASIDRKATPFHINNRLQFLQKLLPLTTINELRQHSIKQDELKLTHVCYEQYFKGVKVEKGEYTVHSQNDTIMSVTGNFEKIDPAFSIKPVLTKDQAIKAAVNNIHAKTYSWNKPEAEQAIKTLLNDPAATYYPKPELLIANVGEEEAPNYVLVYRFIVSATEPAINDQVYIDARTGKLLLRFSIIQDAAGTAATRYSGTVSIETTLQSNGSWLLSDATRGSGIATRNFNNTGFVTDFIDNDNNWSAAEFNNTVMDNAALDVHWGLEQVYDYFRTVHGRNSYDGNGAPINAFVHAIVSGTPDNAGWDPVGHALGFGDGQTTFNPVAAPDVVAHEFGHALFQSTVYRGGNPPPPSDEHAAINEGFSDLWGACIDNYLNLPNKNPWLIGEQVMRNGAIALRSLRNPNELQQPDTYNGTNWTNGDYHMRAGVLDFWFYLLCQGGSGNNDIGWSYNVKLIGITNAARIIYNTLTGGYLNASSKYADVRFATISAASAIFGSCSSQVTQVINAWRAVGVGPYNTINVDISGPGSICTNTTGNNFSIAPVDNASRYTWAIYPSAGTSLSGRLNNISVVVSNAGNYSLTVSVTTTCGATAGGEWGFVARMNKPGTDCSSGGGGDEPDRVSVSPNPARNNIIVTSKTDPASLLSSRNQLSGINTSNSTENEIRVIDVTGVIRLVKKVRGDTFTVVLNASELRTGTYFVQIINSEGKITNKRVAIVK